MIYKEQLKYAAIKILTHTHAKSIKMIQYKGQNEIKSIRNAASFRLP